MPCGALFTTPRVSISALNSVRGAEYYANYSAKYNGGGGCPPVSSTPAPVTPDPVLLDGIKNQVKAKGGHGLTLAELGHVLRAMQLEGALSPSQAQALTAAIEQKCFQDAATDQWASQVAAGVGNALQQVLELKAATAPEMDADLDCAAKTGRGITKAELKNVVAKHADGQGLLSAEEKATLAKHLEKGSFASKSASAAASKLAAGGPLSLVGIRTL